MKAALLLLFSLFLVSCCTRQKTSSSTCCVFPKTSIHLYLGSGSGEILAVSQSGETVHVSRDSQTNEVALNSSYRELLQSLLESQKWKTEANKDPYLGVWTGSPRNIFRMEHQDLGLSLQGEKIPGEWLSKISEYVDRNL